MTDSEPLAPQHERSTHRADSSDTTFDSVHISGRHRSSASGSYRKASRSKKISKLFRTLKTKIRAAKALLKGFLALDDSDSGSSEGIKNEGSSNKATTSPQRPVQTQRIVPRDSIESYSTHMARQLARTRREPQKIPIVVGEAAEKNPNIEDDQESSGANKKTKAEQPTGDQSASH